MARRSLMLLIESNAETCGRCQRMVFDFFAQRYVCRYFGLLKEIAEPNTDGTHVARHPDCLRAETFAGG